MRFVVHDRATGTILRQGVVPDPTPDDPAPHLRQARTADEVAIVPPKGVPVDDGKHRVDPATGAIVDRPAPTAEEARAAALTHLRARRSAHLAASDWTQLPDASLPPAARAAWATYRQALRDLPATSPDPAKPVWPQAPKE